jgi:hypothetical protein
MFVEGTKAGGIHAVLPNAMVNTISHGPPVFDSVNFIPPASKDPSRYASDRSILQYIHPYH